MGPVSFSANAALCVSHCCCYCLPPTFCRWSTNYLLNCIDRLIREHPHAGVVLLGDFNEMPLYYHIHSDKSSERQRVAQQYLIKYTRISANGTNNRSPFQRLVDRTTTLLSCFHSSLILGRCLQLMIQSCINFIRVVKRLYNKLCSESTGCLCILPAEPR